MPSRPAERLYYFGARYYDPRTSLWVKPDPILAVYLEGEGSGDGVYTPPNLNLYSYVQQRPLGAIDPDGQACISAYLSSYCTRSRLYKEYDTHVADKTRYFGAASMTTEMFGSLSGAGESIASVFNSGVSGATETRMKEISSQLESLNRSAFARIRSGELAGPDLDQQMVTMEQTAVQGYLNKLKESDPQGHTKFVSEVNTTLDPQERQRRFIEEMSTSDAQYLGVLDRVRTNLGGKIDFANQEHREAIGMALIEHIRAKGMPE